MSTIHVVDDASLNVPHARKNEKHEVYPHIVFYPPPGLEHICQGSPVCIIFACSGDQYHPATLLGWSDEEKTLCVVRWINGISTTCPSSQVIAAL